MVHSTTFRVRFGELDPYNHVNHAVYVAWFEAGRGEALESIGMSLPAMAELGFQVVVTDLSVSYKVPAAGGDEVTVETWVSEIGGARSTWSQRITRWDAPDAEPTEPTQATETIKAINANQAAEANQAIEAKRFRTVLCTAEVRAGSTNSQGRPTRMPLELRTALSGLLPDTPGT